MTGSRADTVDGARDDRGPALAVDPTSKGRARPAPPPLGFMVAAGGATIVVALGAIVLELNPPARIEGLLPELVAGAALCVGLLARRWAPALAWVALIVASLVGASIPIAVSRAADPVATGLGTWLLVAARSSVAAILTVFVAALYATRSDRRSTARVTTLATFLVAWLVVACLLVVVLVIAGARYDPAFTWVDLATWPTSVFIQFVLVLTAFGVAADLRAASLRADGRLAADPGSRNEDDQHFGDRLRATLRELVPGQGRPRPQQSSRSESDSPAISTRWSCLRFVRRSPRSRPVLRWRRSRGVSGRSTSSSSG